MGGMLRLHGHRWWALGSPEALEVRGCTRGRVRAWASSEDAFQSCVIPAGLFCAANRRRCQARSCMLSWDTISSRTAAGPSPPPGSPGGPHCREHGTL